MSQGIRELTQADLLDGLESVLLPWLKERIRTREAGHCMRISDLDQELMIRLCGRLRSEIADVNIVMLSDGGGRVPGDIVVSSTKLVELRNPNPDGSQRPPLLVFVPNDIRASAEDSFGVATFEEIRVQGIYETLREQLVDTLSPIFRDPVREVLRVVVEGEKPWPFADKLAIVRFLLTAKVNGGDAESIGAGLYELGLVPDFELLAQPERAAARVFRNRDCVERITWSSRSERGRALDLGLSKQDFRKELGDFLADAGVEDPRLWTRAIVVDRSNWCFAFNKWEFEDGGASPDSIFIGDVQVDVPVFEDSDNDLGLSELNGQRVLVVGKNGLRRFSVSFRVDPHPSRVQGLRRFVAQVISRENGPIGLVRRKAAWTRATDSAKVSFSSLGKVEWEEGWHFVRLLAETDSGDLVPLVNESGDPVPWNPAPDAAIVRPNESDAFYVLANEDVEVEPQQRAVPREPSLAHARMRAQFIAAAQGRDPAAVSVTSVEWLAQKASGQGFGAGTLVIKLGREGAFHVPLSPVLLDLERQMLAMPVDAISWRMQVEQGVACSPVVELTGWPEGPEAQRFVEVRKRYFDLVRASSTDLITQGLDPAIAKPLAIDYASSYLDMLQSIIKRANSAEGLDAQAALLDLRRILSVDSVRIVITDYRDRYREAALVSPLNPLRAIWFSTWARVGDGWLQVAARGAREFLGPTRDALLRQLAPAAFPPVIPTESGRVLTAVDNLNQFWSLYAPSGETDPRGLVGEVCTAMGLPEPAIGGALIDGAYLASRAQRYLAQHPYVRTFVVNAFNAGRATVLADMLLDLQRRPAFSDLRYDIRLFVPDPDTPGVGEALIDLLSPESGTTGREADAFVTPTESHLRPKLRLAIRSTSEFRDSPEDHGAHISMLFDVFPAEEIQVIRPAPLTEMSAVYGLVQRFAVGYTEDDDFVAWHRRPMHGPASPLEGDEELSDLLSGLARTMSSATAMVATGQVGVDLRPVVTLVLKSDERALLHQVHEVSDWVVTLDRNMGIEFFDHRHHPTRPDYLIDHSPDMANALGHRLVITSRSISELEALLKPVLADYGIQVDGAHALVILAQLRSLSGRLALKLISAPNQRAEALGLALSRLYLEHQGVFSNQIVVPLDAHIDLYRALKQQADELGDEVSFKRTDLALFDLDAVRRVITCRLVEVKCYSQVGGLASYNQLKQAVSAQISQSEQVIAWHFDPSRTEIDRADRPIKVRDLSALLEFYLDRSCRYGVIAQDAADEARYFISTLESGYQLRFTKSALIFDFEKTGTEPAEWEFDIEFHRIGLDLIKQLIDAAAPETVSASADSMSSIETMQSADALATAELRRRRERAYSVPALHKAEFLGAERDRTVTLEKLDIATYSPPQTAINYSKVPAQSEQKAQDSVPSPESGGEAVVSAVSSPSENQASVVSPGTLEDLRSEQVDSPAPPAEEQVVVSEAAPRFDVMLGVPGDSPQYGIVGDVAGRKVALDLNQTHTISLFGVQGGGKSYTLGSIAEMASLRIPGVNMLPRPLATVIFHYSPTMDYRPEFTSMVSPNTVEDQIRQLRENYGAQPQGLSDVLLLAPADKVDERKEEYPDIEVIPLKFSAAELQSSHWRFLMGAVGNQATYIRQLNRLMKTLRSNLTIEALRHGIDNSPLPDHLKDLARMRLDLAAEYIDDTVNLSEVIRPGRLIIVDLRDEFIEKDEALGLFVVLLQLFADAKYQGEAFNKLVVFDEAHKYIESPDLVAGLVEVVREMRHKGTSILVASQDPPSVPVSLIELSSQIVIHKFNSPAWLKHLQKANAALAALSAERMASLGPGEAFIWSSKASDEAFTKGAIKIRCRPRVTQHGGGTKTAVSSL
ncbi:MAG: ATP-binding protein [Burkholderiales bacterium]|nr:ATP-binding protein [Burkholderiales bacterium]